MKGNAVILRLLLNCSFFLWAPICFVGYAQANESFEKKPNHLAAAVYNTKLGLAYLGQGDRDRAKAKLLLALKEDPTSAYVNGAMAYYLEQAGELERSRAYYLNAIKLSAQDGASMNNYGAFLCRHGQYLKAETYFLKAVLDEHYAHTSGVYENAGLCMMAIDKTRAAFYFKKALRQDPLRKQSLLMLVNIEIKQGHVDSALAQLQKYPKLVSCDKKLRALGVKLAHKAQNAALEARFKQQMNTFSDKCGVKNEYNTDNG